jgi:hypothetical protein
MLAENAVGTFFWSEWGATLDQWGKKYAQDTMSIFTALYDGGYFSRWLKNEKYEIESSCVSLLCGCTYSWLKRTMKQGDIAMGFWPRFLFVPAMKRTRYMANPPRGDQELRDRIEAILKFMQELFLEEYRREANFQEVEGMYEDWYNDRNKAADAETGNEELASFTVRLSDYAKKLAILIEISRKQDWKDITVNIQPGTMHYTIGLCDWLLSTSQYVLGEVEQDEMSALEQKI